jgi:hypothetical protein
MAIIGRLQTEFRGMTAMITGFIDALRAYRAYNRALKDIDALKMVKKEKLIEVYKYIVVHKKRYGDTQELLEGALANIEMELHLSHSESMALRREVEEAI